MVDVVGTVNGARHSLSAGTILDRAHQLVRAVAHIA
jgi:hypothetical protein